MLNTIIIPYIFYVAPLLHLKKYPQTNTCHVLSPNQPGSHRNGSPSNGPSTPAPSAKGANICFSTAPWIGPIQVERIFETKNPRERHVENDFVSLLGSVSSFWGKYISKYLKKVWRNKPSWRINTPRKFNSSPPLKKTAIPKGNDRLPIINFQGLKCEILINFAGVGVFFRLFVATLKTKGSVYGSRWFLFWPQGGASYRAGKKN